MISGKTDLAYTVAMEILAPIELTDFRAIELTKLTAEIADTEISDALKRIADANRPFSDKGENAKAEKDDRVTVSFVGKIGGNAFEGGTAEDIAVPIGSGTFIPGFEDQLLGVAAGDEKLVKVTFPQNYLNAELAGKEAEFDVKVKSIEAPKDVTIDDEFAKSLGMESLDKLKDALRDRIKQEHDRVSRQRVKRALLDVLDERHQFELPHALVDQEFENLWRVTTEQMKQENKTFADENTTEEAAKEDYRKIANRRVRLGLVLAEIGDKNAIKITDEEVTRAIVEQARQMPGTRAAGLGLLSQESERACRIARPDFRGEGRRFPARARQGDREDRLARRTLQGRGRRRGGVNWCPNRRLCGCRTSATAL